MVLSSITSRSKEIDAKYENDVGQIKKSTCRCLWWALGFRGCGFRVYI
jgi:hypothetical protein